MNYPSNLRGVLVAGGRAKVVGFIASATPFQGNESILGGNGSFGAVDFRATHPDGPERIGCGGGTCARRIGAATMRFYGCTSTLGDGRTFPIALSFAGVQSTASSPLKKYPFPGGPEYLGLLRG